MRHFIQNKFFTTILAISIILSVNISLINSCSLKIEQTIIMNDNNNIIGDIEK